MWIQVTDPFGQKEAMRFLKRGTGTLFEVAVGCGWRKIPLEKRNTSNPNLWYWRFDSLHLISKGIKYIYRCVGGTQ